MSFEPGRIYHEMMQIYSDNYSEDNKVIICNSGGSRSSKTWDFFHWIYTFCDHNRNQNQEIYFLRDKLVDCRDFTFNEFEKCMRIIDKWDESKVRTSPKPYYNLLGNHIYGRGLDEDKEAPPSDIIFINEGLEINSKKKIKGWRMRCRKALIMDWNPKYTEHWCFDQEGQPNTFFTNSTYRDNKHLERSVITEIEEYCPWHFDDLHIEDEKKRRPHPFNVRNGTADKHQWLVYGEGKKSVQEGAIFKHINYIDEWPADIGYSYGLDFGFTCFAGNTLVDTINGQVKIKDINPGDKVLTRKGYKTVLRKFDNGIKKVIKRNIDIDCGYKEITATFDHNFYINDKWKKYGKLIKGDVLYVRSNFLENLTEDTQAESIPITILGNGERKAFSAQKDCITLYMNITKAKFRKAFIFTIKTLTLLITATIIWLLLLLRSMQKFTAHYLNICKQIKPLRIEKRTGIIKAIGMIGEKLLLKTSRAKLGNAIIAERNTRQRIHTKDSVIKNVITDGSMLLKLIILKCNAMYVVQNMWETNTLNQRLADQDALINYQAVKGIKTISDNTYERVYDLQIEDAHEYFAEGILVHNCDPSALVKGGENRTDIYMELLMYQPTERPEDISQYMDKIGISRLKPITADSSDKYTGENKGTVEMVCGLFNLGWRKIAKVHKTKSIMFWLSSMKGKRINIINNDLVHHFRKEQENYVMKEINGVSINQPIDGWDHALSAARYNHMALNQPTAIKSRKG